MNYNKPKILISKCLEFDYCRHDGKLITNENVRKLKKYVNFITICPEVEIGLGIPRDSINLIYEKNKKKLYQSNTNNDITNKMEKFSINYVNNIKYLDGIIFKSKSPSCGIKTTKIFSNKNMNDISGYGSGIFAHHVITKFSNIPKQEDSELNFPELRNHFYTSIFIIADYRKIKSFKELYVFHAKHKLLFMSLNQLDLKELGKIATNHDEKSITQILENYFNLLLEILSKKPTNESHINTQMYAFGYYKNQLSEKQKQKFLNLLKKNKVNKNSLDKILNIINSWNNKFENEYLLKQSYFSPYPKELFY